jgi:alkylation response protein AidB-like acyl-CoA dehydrogenase
LGLHVSQTEPDIHTETATHHELLGRARHIASTVFAPNATRWDQSDSPPGSNIQHLVDAGLMGLSTPSEFGGMGAPRSVQRQYTETIAAACGVTNFVQGQHQSAATLIAGGENDRLKREILPKLATGEILCGVAFAHLRRPGPPTMRAVVINDGWVFDGTAPWFTGWGIFNHCVLGGTLPDGNLLYVVIPLDEHEHLCASEPMRLCAMNASATVSITCRELRVPRECYMKTISREQMARNDEAAILVALPQTFGVTSASIALLRKYLETRHNKQIEDAALALDSELAELRTDAGKWFDLTATPAYKENALRIRAWAIDLGVRAAHAAVIAGGGGTNNLNHPAQRLYREAMFYTLTAQTPDVQTASLKRIVDRSNNDLKKTN